MRQIKNKDDITIILKIALIIYIAILSIDYKVPSLIIVAFILLYLIATFSRVLFNSKFYIYFILIEVLLSIYVALNYLEPVIVFACISILEYFNNRDDNYILGVIVSLIPLSLVTSFRDIKELALISLLSIIIIITSEKTFIKIKNDEIMGGKQRKEIYNLEKRLLKERDIQEQLIHTVKLEERNKISGELHDKIGHTISGTLLQLEAIKLIIDTNKEKGYEMLDNSIENLRSGMDDIRMTLRNIRPVDQELGVNRFRMILDEKLKGTKIKGTVSYSGDLEKIPTSIWIIFIQAITELSTNSIKYSQCDLITINLEVLKRVIKLEVKDNGVGQEKIIKGIGLKSIEERISTHDGKLIINSENGFSAILLIPC